MELIVQLAQTQKPVVNAYILPGDMRVAAATLNYLRLVGRAQIILDTQVDEVQADRDYGDDREGGFNSYVEMVVGDLEQLVQSMKVEGETITVKYSIIQRPDEPGLSGIVRVDITLTTKAADPS